MNSREKLLAIGVGILVVLGGSTKGVSKYREACERNEKKLLKVLDDLENARLVSARGQRAQSRLAELGRQSLPKNTDIAATRYESWLRDQLDKSGLEVEDVSIKTSLGPHKQAQEIAFTVSAIGSLSQLSNFLYDFYQAGHLHRISETTLVPEEGEDWLNINLTIDALSLNNCKREEKLSDRPSKVKMLPLENYQTDIVSRNIFAVYRPPVSDGQPASTQLTLAGDAVAAKARITGMTSGVGGWQMSVRMQDSGEVKFFREGDSIAIGRFVGTITKLDGRWATVTIGNEPMRVRLGQSLSQAQPIAELAG